MNEGAESKREVVALIPAAGAGKRMGEDCPKQFLPLKGKPLLAHTLERFQESSLIDCICLVVPKGSIVFCRKEIVDRYGLTKVFAIVEGGEERQDSVYKGFLRIASSDRFYKAVQDDALRPSTSSDGGAIEKLPKMVLVHDGARPFVSDRLIQEVLQAARACGAGAAGLPCWDTMKETDGQGVVLRTLDRSRLWRVQTPQCFRYPILREALEGARRYGFYGTDEAFLVERRGYEVKMVLGDPYNLKITTPEDFLFGEWLLEKGWVSKSESF